MNGWIELTSAGKSKEKVRIKVDTIVGIRPCGTAAYGANVDLNTIVGLVAVEESPDQVWQMIKDSTNAQPKNSDSAVS